MARETKNRPASEQAPLPEFGAPPLFETVFGVRFPRLKRWQAPHFGLYWDRIVQDYPKCETKGPLPAPGRRTAEEGVQLQLVTSPDVRCWFLSSEGDRLLQVQHDGFFHNWRKVTLEEVYPRYAKIRPALRREWERFRAFLAERDIGAPEVVECEATYVNHFERGREWSSAADLGDILEWWSPPTETEKPIPTPDRVAFNARIDIGDDRLDVQLAPAVRKQDGHEIFQFSLAVKGQPESSASSDIMAWMDRARATIVRSFTDLTTAEMHQLWERGQ